MMEIDVREMKGNTIAHLEGQIKRVQDSFYLVKSQSGHGKYEAIAEKWLNIVSEEPEKISRVDADLELRRQREEFERNVTLVVRRELAKERLKRRE